MEGNTREEAFPAPRRVLSGIIKGLPTEVTRTDFADKVLLTISQEGRLAQWIQVPLIGSSADTVGMTLPGGGSNRATSLLPHTHFTPKTLLGAGGEARDALGHLYAAQFASLFAMKAPEDRRILVLGLGLAKTEHTEEETFYDMIDLARDIV